MKDNKNLKFVKILICISIIILILGSIIGFSIANEIISRIDTSVDESSATYALVTVGAQFIGYVVFFASIAIDIFIWMIYGIVILIKFIIKKVNENNEENTAEIITQNKE